MGGSKNPSSSSTPSSSAAKYSSTAKDEPDDTGDDNEATEEQKKDEDSQEAKDLINSFKSMTGGLKYHNFSFNYESLTHIFCLHGVINMILGLWGDIDPPDSKWLKLSVTDKNTGETTPKGEVCYSIQIWPKDKALVMPVGAARSEPNTNPYLPPPVGRLKWSWNPFVLGICCTYCSCFHIQ